VFLQEDPEYDWTVSWGQNDRHEGEGEHSDLDEKLKDLVVQEANYAFPESMEDTNHRDDRFQIAYYIGWDYSAGSVLVGVVTDAKEAEEQKSLAMSRTREFLWQVRVAKQEQRVPEEGTRVFARKPNPADVHLQEMQSVDYVHLPHAWTPLAEEEEGRMHLTSLA
jgi:hypothetical protein